MTAKRPINHRQPAVARVVRAQDRRVLHKTAANVVGQKSGAYLEDVILLAMQRYAADLQSGKRSRHA